MLPALYSFTLFLSAALLFWVEPMIAKMLLPLLGGTPSVWNTCMVFFQAALLAGYAAAHALTARCGLKLHAALQGLLLLTGLACLPLALRESAVSSVPTDATPVPWLLTALAVMVGLPFVALAAVGPALQRWFSLSGHRSAQDPYFLFAASNAGSLVSLLAYPTLIEPNFTLAAQRHAWGVAYFALLGLVAVCAVATVWKRKPASAEMAATMASTTPETGRAGLRQRLRWLALAAVPSSLMLGVTTFITTDIASIPLLWVIPLALYLLTFVHAFARRRFIATRHLWCVVPFAVMALVFALLVEASYPIWLILMLHVCVFTIVALACNGQLADERPPACELTRFYLWISLGGVSGGVFNALLAPLLFNRVGEYPVALVLGCLLRPGFAQAAAVRVPRLPRWLPNLASVAAAGAAALLIAHLAGKLGPAANPKLLALAFGVPAFFAAPFLRQPVRFVSVLGAVLIAASVAGGPNRDQVIHVERNFFGTTLVTRDAANRFLQIQHGNTTHGRQFISGDRRCEPLAYYHPTGPLGDLFAAFNARPGPQRIAAIGLGSGAMLTYATPQHTWTIYELDPAAIHAAFDTNLFTFATACTTTRPTLIRGDARLQIARAPDAVYDLLLIDAFSSDAIPIHLLTREALQLYLKKLAPGGVIALHISSRYLNLAPVITRLASDAKLAARFCLDHDNDPAIGKEQSHWVVLARQPDDFGKFRHRARWEPPEPRPGTPLWTDDFSNLLGVFEWR